MLGLLCVAYGAQRLCGGVDAADPAADSPRPSAAAAAASLAGHADDHDDAAARSASRPSPSPDGCGSSKAAKGGSGGSGGPVAENVYLTSMGAPRTPGPGPADSVAAPPPPRRVRVSALKQQPPATGSAPERKKGGGRTISFGPPLPAAQRHVGPARSLAGSLAGSACSSQPGSPSGSVRSCARSTAGSVTGSDAGSAWGAASAAGSAVSAGGPEPRQTFNFATTSTLGAPLRVRGDGGYAASLARSSVASAPRLLGLPREAPLAASKGVSRAGLRALRAAVEAAADQGRFKVRSGVGVGVERRNRGAVGGGRWVWKGRCKVRLRVGVGVDWRSQGAVGGGRWVWKGRLKVR
eukprot:355690-Chlamydomonas_euryale.AAC.2